MTNKTSIETAAKQLSTAEASRVTCAPVREIIGATDIEAAYAVQEINTKHKLANGHRIIGKKIGLTSFSVQEQLGVDQPDYGMLFDYTKVNNGAVVAIDMLMQPKVEAEIAFVLKDDLNQDNLTEEMVANAIEYACASIEIVGSRVEGWNIRITDTVADNASASHFVLGDRKVMLEDMDLINCKMQMSKNGSVASEGKGEACLGSPLKAALWLAETMKNLGSPLKAGDIVLTGALGPMVNVQSGDNFTAEIDGLGNVSVAFA